jgi:hypothetical protein
MPNLYWIGSIDTFWETTQNWKFNANGTGVSPDAIPWSPIYNSEGVEIGTNYGNYDLVPVGSQSPILTSILGSFATGTCSMHDVTLFDTGNYPQINSGKWTGNNLALSVNTFLNGGEFTGTLLIDAGIIKGGKFSGNSISVGTDGQGNTTLSIIPQSGNPIIFAYPTPASGGGGDATIARLLNLPWFIKI